MNNKGFFFYYGVSLILLMLSCLIIGISKTLGGLMFAFVVVLQTCIYFSTLIPNRKLLWERSQCKNNLISYCDGEIKDIITVKRSQVKLVLESLHLDGEPEKNLSEEWYMIKVNTCFPQGPDRRSPLDGRVKIMNLLNPTREDKGEYIKSKYKGYDFWYYFRSNHRDQYNNYLSILIGDNSLQKSRGISEFIPFCNMLNDCSELLYDGKDGIVTQSQPISALYFKSKSIIFIPKDSYQLKVVKDQTLVGCQTILAEYIKPNAKLPSPRLT